MAEFLSTGKASKMEYSDLRQGKRKSSVGRNFLAKKKKKKKKKVSKMCLPDGEIFRVGNFVPQEMHEE